MVVKFPVSPSARARLRRRANPSTAAVRKPRQRSERELEYFRTFGPRLWPGVSDAVEWLDAHSDDPLLLPLTPEQTTRLADLETRLKLSEEYQAQIKQVRAKLGLPGVERGQEKALIKLSGIEFRIYRLPAQTTGDTRIKLALYPCVWV